MSNKALRSYSKQTFRRAQCNTLTKVNSLGLSVSQALFLNILTYTLDFMGKHNLMSFGPNGNKIGGGGIKDQIAGKKALGGYKKFGFAIRKGTSDYSVYPNLSKSTSLVVNKYLFSGLRRVSKFIPYQGVTTNCVNRSSFGRWLNGIPNIGFSPYLLHYSIAAYKSGFNPYLLRACL